MSLLKRLVIKQLRNLQSVSVDLSPKLNIFYGDNGDGKTSLLEAVALLGLGRSFRSHKTRSLVNHQQAELTVFAEIFSADAWVPVGVQKLRNGRGLIRVAGETVRSAATLAKQLPLLIINADSFQLIEGSPAQRRQFLDWMVFHVKPDFSRLWKDLQKTLKQRNSLLRRDKIDYSDLEPWNLELIRLAHGIDKARAEVFALFTPLFSQLETEFTDPSLQIELEYSRGWDNDQSLESVLKIDFERDRRVGYTHHGPQRADITIRARQKPAVEVLSRGQEKALVCAMTIAQAQLYQQCMARDCVFLVDDLLAELDISHSQTLASWLTALNGQVLVTGVSKAAVLGAWENEATAMAVFHVKRGEVEAVAV
jgi:DNA replication and repair protein RecF